MLMAINRRSNAKFRAAIWGETRAKRGRLSFEQRCATGGSYAHSFSVTRLTYCKLEAVFTSTSRGNFA